MDNKIVAGFNWNEAKLNAMSNQLTTEFSGLNSVITTETANIKKLIDSAYNGLNNNLTNGFAKVKEQQVSDFTSLNNGIGSIASTQGNEFAQIKGSINANASLVNNKYLALDGSLNGVSQTVNENKLALESIGGKINNITNKLDSMDAKLDILLRNMKVSSIDNLDIQDLAESYEAYYTTFKRENGRDATLEEKMKFVITYLKNRSYVRSN